MGSSPLDWVPPKRFAEYRLIRALGRGSMGQVWLAHDSVLDRLVAVKFLSELAGDDAARQRFLTEARAAARMQHPNVIAIYRVGEIGPRPYLISEYVRGDSLDRIARPVAWPRLLEIALGLARGLAAAHQRGVLHRDLKPGNAILAKTGEIKLLDFGLAKLVRHGDEPASSDDATLRTGGAADAASDGDDATPDEVTAAGAHGRALGAVDAASGPLDADTIPVVEATRRDAPRSPGGGIALPDLTGAGSVMGTPAYMSPEAWRGEAGTARSDVYSLGALLYELAAGVPPHRGDSQQAVRRAALETDAAPLATAAPGIDRRFAAIVDRCVRRAPGERFASGEAVREPLEALGVAEGLRSSGIRAPVEAAAPGASAEAAEATEAAALARADAASVAEGLVPADSVRSRAARWRMRRGRTAGAAVLAMGAVLAAWSLGRGLLARRGAGHGHVAAAATAPAGPCPDDMVAVPAGGFQIGSRDGVGDADEHPRHTVALSAYCLDRTEVTVAAYAACVAAGACGAPPLTVNWSSYSADDVRRYSRRCNRSDRPTHPINCVDWELATAYCAWLGRRLPTEAEWEYAARGGDDRVYPWGNAPPSATRLNACGSECGAMARRDGTPISTLHDGDDGWEATAPVGSYPDGASPFGALDMAGNVWEWTADWYGSYDAAPADDPQGAPSGTSRVSRGAGWSSGGTEGARAADRDWLDPKVRETSLGFRCARGRG